MHYKNRVSAFLVFLLFKEKIREKMITGISGFGFLGSKNGRFVTVNCCCFFVLLKSPNFLVFWGRAFFGPSCKKKPKNTEHFDR